MKKLNAKNCKAITLIALIITIIIILIISSVAITLSISNNGIFDRTKYATKLYLNEQEKKINILHPIFLIYMLELIETLI